MSPRPRTVADADILTATHRMIARIGPARFTLADVAGEVGLSPATLVQRFGSKRGLMLALVEQAVASVETCFATVRAVHRSPLAAVIAAATEMTRHVRAPEEMANHLAFLQEDLSDRDFHRLALENSRRLVAGYRSLLDDAVAAGELVPCDTVALARAVDALSGGSLIGWAINREGTAERWVRRDLAALLDPYRTAASARREARRTGRKTRNRNAVRDGRRHRTPGR